MRLLRLNLRRNLVDPNLDLELIILNRSVDVKIIYRLLYLIVRSASTVQQQLVHYIATPSMNSTTTLVQNQQLSWVLPPALKKESKRATSVPKLRMILTLSNLFMSYSYLKAHRWKQDKCLTNPTDINNSAQTWAWEFSKTVPVPKLHSEPLCQIKVLTKSAVIRRHLVLTLLYKKLVKWALRIIQWLRSTICSGVNKLMKLLRKSKTTSWDLWNKKINWFRLILRHLVSGMKQPTKFEFFLVKTQSRVLTLD